MQPDSPASAAADLLDNYLPDGKGVLIDTPLLKSHECSVIFITAASDMQTCSHASAAARLIT